jgi:D-sedoheptulose 7-phosphate isomerase
MTFPDQRFACVGAFTDAYFERLASAARSVCRAKLERAAHVLAGVYESGGTVFSCGNGGSAAIANHMVLDHAKLIRTDTPLLPRVVSLSATPEMITATANDIAFAEVFRYQLEALARPGDALLTVSSSGDSENVVAAVCWAKERGMPVISMTGFSGGRSAELADVNLHVDADNYGVIEDVHQCLMHILAQYIRQSRMEEAVIRERKF